MRESRCNGYTVEAARQEGMDARRCTPTTVATSLLMRYVPSVIYIYIKSRPRFGISRTAGMAALFLPQTARGGILPVAARPPPTSVLQIRPSRIFTLAGRRLCYLEILHYHTSYQVPCKNSANIFIISHSSMTCNTSKHLSSWFCDTILCFVLSFVQVRQVNSTLHLTGTPTADTKDALRSLLKPPAFHVSYDNKRPPPATGCIISACMSLLGVSVGSNKAICPRAI